MREPPSRAEAARDRRTPPACVLSAVVLLALTGPAQGADSRIAPGEPLHLPINGGQVQAFTVHASAGDFVRVVAHQEGTDVVLAVETAQGSAIESDVVEASTGHESVSLLAPSAGDLRIEVRSKAPAGSVGSVTLVSEVRGDAHAGDEDRIAMEAALRSAERLRNQGTGAARQEAVGQYEAALRLARGIPDPFGAALAAQGAGLTRSALGEYRQAFAQLEDALGGWRSLGLPVMEAKALHGQGTARYYMGDTEAALELYLRALPLRRASGDRAGESRTLTSIGAAYGALGRLQESIEYTEQSLALKRAIGERAGEAGALHNLAITYHTTGQVQQALDVLREALPLAEAEGTNDLYARPAILSSTAGVYTTLGEADEALRYLGRALEAWRQIGDPSGEATTLHQLGSERLDRGDPAGARQYFEQALTLLRTASGTIGRTLLALADVERRLENRSRAEELAAEAVREAERTGSPLAQVEAQILLGQLRADVGDLARAQEHQLRALSLARTVGDREGEARSLHELGRVSVRQGALAEARDHLEGCLAVLAAIRADVRGLELRATFAARTGPVHEDYVDVLVRLHEREPGAGWLARAFEASERGRAQTMVETLAASRVGTPADLAPERLERTRSLQHQLAARLDRQLRLLTGPHTAEEERAEREAVEALRSDLRVAQADLGAAGPRFAALEQPPVLSLRDVQERVLDADTLLLEYALGKERGILFVVGKTTLSAHRLSSREAIEKSVGDALEALARPARGADGAGAPALLAKLSAELLAPAGAEIEGKRLVVVPDGPLDLLPFAALPSPARPGEALVERHQVVTVPSASLVELLRAEAAQRPAPTRSVLVFADPVFDRHDERVSARAAGAGAPLPRNLTRAIEDAGMGSQGLGRLPFTRREATAIVDLVRDGRARLDFEASRQNVTTADLASYRLVHFATHGFLNSAHPELSGLVLSLFDRSGAPRDGFLSAAEVANLELSADLVVLSGCRTALGRQIRGEGVVGLTRALMYAGTSRVLASLWKVDDAATAELMRRLYQGLLRDRLPPAEALQRAQRAMARHRHWSHPYYWAGFQLQGDWR
jgi:CHAT domain-containing protein